MAKEKVKLSLDQETEGVSVMTAEEASDLGRALVAQGKEADNLTDEKKEGRVELEIADGRVTVSVIKVKIEKEEEDDPA